MARRRSREAESRLVNRRLLGPGAVGPDQLGLQVVRNRHLWPESVDRTKIAPGSVLEHHLDPEVSDRFQAGQCITVYTPSYSIPDGGGKVEFSQIIETIRHGMGDPTLPLSGLLAPWAGVTQPRAWGQWLDVDHDSSWKGQGVWAQWLRNDVPVGPQFPVAASLLPVSLIDVPAMYVPVNQLDELSLWLQQDSGSPQDVEMFKSWGLQDPKAASAQMGAPASMRVQARVWPDGGEEPEAWDIDFLWDDDPVVSGRPGIRAGSNATSGRLCDWVGVSTSPSTPAPGPGDGGGQFTDFCEPAHTTGSPPADGWEPAVHSPMSGNTNVESVGMSTSPCGRSLRRNTSGSGDLEDPLVWTNVSAGGYMEVLGAVASQNSGDSASGLIVMFDGERYVTAIPNVNTNTLAIGVNDGPNVSDRTVLTSVGKSLSANTWYRLRARMTPEF